jgi:hypothetical protein
MIIILLIIVLVLLVQHLILMTQLHIQPTTVALSVSILCPSPRRRWSTSVERVRAP